MDPDSAVFGFYVVDPSIRGVALDKLKLKKHPPTSLVVPLLEKSAPQTQAGARQWFEVLAGRLSGKASVLSELKTDIDIGPLQNSHRQS